MFDDVVQGKLSPSGELTIIVGSKVDFDFSRFLRIALLARQKTIALARGK